MEECEWWGLLSGETDLREQWTRQRLLVSLYKSQERRIYWPFAGKRSLIPTSQCVMQNGREDWLWNLLAPLFWSRSTFQIFLLSRESLALPVSAVPWGPERLISSSRPGSGSFWVPIYIYICICMKWVPVQYLTDFPLSQLSSFK